MGVQISIANRTKKAAPRLGDALRQGESEGARTSKWPWRGFVFLLGLGALFAALSARSSDIEAGNPEKAGTVDPEEGGVEIVTEVQPAPEKAGAPEEALAPKGPPEPASGPFSQGAPTAVATQAEPEAAAPGFSVAGARTAPDGLQALDVTGVAAADARPIGADQVALPLQGAARGGGAAPVPAGRDAVASPDASSEQAEADPPNELGDLLADLDRILGRFPDIHAEQIMDYALGDILREVPVERLFGETETGEALSHDAVFRLSGDQKRGALAFDGPSLPVGADGTVVQGDVPDPAAAPQEFGEFGFF